jgi:hypothetical protein
MLVPSLWFRTSARFTGEKRNEMCMVGRQGEKVDA